MIEHDEIATLTEQTARWSAAKRQAVSLLAVGLSQQRVADRIGRSLSAVEKWVNEPLFERCVQVARALALQHVEAELMQNLVLAAHVQREALNGELDPQDERHKLADRLLARVYDAWLRVRAPDPAALAPGASLTVSATLAGGPAATDGTGDPD